MLFKKGRNNMETLSKKSLAKNVFKKTLDKSCNYMCNCNCGSGSGAPKCQKQRQVIINKNLENIYKN